jgi:hypothetical protein
MPESYRGFAFERVPADAGPPANNTPTLRATRGRLALHVEGTDGELPQGWTLAALLRQEIDRLLDPAALRGVEHLN